jgi:exodeoxyribonuclease V gamma subunit
VPGLHLHRSNRIELLGDRLAAAVLAHPPADPFAPIEVVVGSRGMERWLRHTLAERLSVCANVELPFPAAKLDAVVATVLGEDPAAAEPDAWEPEPLAWALLEVLPSLVGEAELELVRGYLDDPRAWQGAIDARQLELSRRLAEVFDRYVTYRPELATAWSSAASAELPAGCEQLGWQRTLWCAMQRHLVGRAHRAGRVAEAERRLRTGGAAPAGLAPLFMFGVSSLPPSWTSLLGALSRHVGVHLFLLCPSDAAWKRARERFHAGPRSGLLDRRGDEPEHPLLASMGRVGQDFQIALESLPEHYADEGGGAFADPAAGCGSALCRLQSDLLAARDPAGAAGRGERVLDEADDSVQMHACYGPTRQVEALRDVLLGILEEHHDLEPRDIVVMTPDIERYAPLVTAVFSQGPERRRERDGRPVEGAEGWGPAGAPRIPFEIADRSVRRLNPVADALLRLLEMAGGRLEASSVVDFLALEPVRTRFGIAAEEMPAIEEWVGRSGIRWARDAEHRAAAGQPCDPQNTWRFGLRRLLLGVAMPDDGRLLAGEDAPGRPVEVRPFDDMEGSGTVLLGKLVGSCTALFEVLAGLERARPVAQWVVALGEALERMTATGPADAWLAMRVRETLDELSAAATLGGSRRDVGLDAIRAALAGRFELASRATPEQSGAVTFCAMRPMRSVPYQVVCLLGMDEDAFPRKGVTLGFDLASRQPRAGDLDPRTEDRYLVLEAILAARRKLVVLYTGRDPKTNERRPPCVPVGELRDLLDRSFVRPPNAAPASASMTTEHALQAFSPSSFLPLHRSASGARVPLSFDRRLLAAAEARRCEPAEPAPFFAGPREHPDERPETVTLEQLARFFRNPAEALLRNRLRIDLEDRAEALSDREPIDLDPLERWELRTAILRRRQDGLEPGEVTRAVRAEGSLPLGYAGKVAAEAEDALVQQMLSRARLLLDGTIVHQSTPVPIDVTLLGTRVVGSLHGVYGSLLVDLRFGDEAPERVVATWLSFLAWHAARPDAGRCVLVLGALDKGEPKVTLLGLERPPDPRSALEALVGIYQSGLRGPIPLFLRSSWEFAKAMREVPLDPARLATALPEDAAAREALARALEPALRAWSEARDADARDRYVERLFEGRCPLVRRGEPFETVDLAFARSALALWGPYFGARRTGKHVEPWLAEALR